MASKRSSDNGSANFETSSSAAQNLANVIANAPAQSMGMLDVVASETMGRLMENAVSVQQQGQTIGTTSMAAICTMILRTGSE